MKMSAWWDGLPVSLAPDSGGLEGRRTGGRERLLEPHWSDDATNLMCFRFSERPCSKNQRQRVIQEDIQNLMVVVHAFNLALRM